ncbi:hypothetical protein [Wenzhouxiangella limi]|uniref:Uncharacterized protein n=1 Tax=Wenzhouxiangella limi TaxID=2707351 RepID=A0A845UXU5_9GAMM|nr:hypothetical protein [Wenzhouxiangella limi]NDY96247.1 hypothetical protein [Wenzhouxiangella limi]
MQSAALKQHPVDEIGCLGAHAMPEPGGSGTKVLEISKIARQTEKIIIDERNGLQPPGTERLNAKSSIEPVPVKPGILYQTSRAAAQNSKKFPAYSLI